MVTYSVWDVIGIKTFALMELMSVLLHDNKVPVNLVMIGGDQIKILAAIDAVYIKNWNQRPTYKEKDMQLSKSNFDLFLPQTPYEKEKSNTGSTNLVQCIVALWEFFIHIVGMSLQGHILWFLM